MKNKKAWSRVPKEVSENLKISGGALRLYTQLAMKSFYLNGKINKKFSVSNKELQATMGCTEITLQRYLKQLKDNKAIEVDIYKRAVDGKPKTNRKIKIL